MVWSFSWLQILLLMHNDEGMYKACLSIIFDDKGKELYLVSTGREYENGIRA